MASKKMTTRIFPWQTPYARPEFHLTDLRRDADSPNRVPRDRLRDETRGLHVLGELTEIFRAGGPSLRRAPRLLHGGKAALQHARPRERRRVGGKARLEPGEHFQPVLVANIVRALNPLDAAERGA